MALSLSSIKKSCLLVLSKEKYILCTYKGHYHQHHQRIAALKKRTKSAKSVWACWELLLIHHRYV